MLLFWMLLTFDALIVTPMRGSFLPLSYRSIHQPRGVFSTVLLKSVAVCFYADGELTGWLARFKIFLQCGASLWPRPVGTVART